MSFETSQSMYHCGMILLPSFLSILIEKKVEPLIAQRPYLFAAAAAGPVNIQLSYYCALEW